jgi:hypothetical protein
VFPAILSFWVADLYFSYVGVIYKVRRLKVREMLAALPDASAQSAGGYATPINPFDGTTRADKMQALRDAALSPAVFVPYVILEAATLLVLVVR